MIWALKFDFLSWVLGQTLSRSLSSITEKTLSGELNRAVDDWASSLPPEFNVHPSAIFRDPSCADLEGRPALAALRQMISGGRVPSVHRWTAALLERWSEVASRGGPDLQAIFQRDEESVVPLIEDLAQRLHGVCASQESLFRRSVIDLLEKLSRDSHLREHPEPLPPGLEVDALHQEIEKLVDCQIDIVALHRDFNELHIWGNRFGSNARDARKKILATALVSANQAERVYVGLSDTKSLRGSDGQGPVGYLRILFTKRELLELAAVGSTPAGFWDGKVAEFPAGDNSPFQQWVTRGWREVEE